MYFHESLHKKRGSNYIYINHLELRKKDTTLVYKSLKFAEIKNFKYLARVTK